MKNFFKNTVFLSTMCFSAMVADIKASENLIENNFNTNIYARLPANFNPEIYLRINPNIAQEYANSPHQNWNVLQYACWQYVNRGANNRARYLDIMNDFNENIYARLPANFNPEIYLRINPNIAQEYANSPHQNWNVLQYACWQYVNQGANNGARYLDVENNFNENIYTRLPGDFNPEIYLTINPNIIQEYANSPYRNWTPQQYACWQYVNHGADNGLKYRDQAQPIANNGNNFNIEDLSIEELREILDVMGAYIEEEDRDDIEYLKATLLSLQDEQLNNARIEAVRVEAQRVAAQEAQRLEENRRIETARRLQAERETVAVAPVAWADMTKAQRILVIAEKIFESPNSNVTFGIPVAADKRIELKNIFEALMADNYINTNAVMLPNAEPANFRMHFLPVSNILRKAVNVQKHETDHGMTRQEAKDFSTFNSSYNVNFANFPLDVTKQIVFYRALKNSFGDMPWADVIKIVTPILEKSLPLDYDQWPNFAVNPAANFDAFIDNIVRPCVIAVRGNADIEAAAEAHVERLLLNIQVSLKNKINHKINAFQIDNNQYIADQLRAHGTEHPLGNVRYLNPISNRQEAVSFSDWTNGMDYLLRDLEDNTRGIPNVRQGIPGLRKSINYSYLCADPFLTLLRLPDERLVPLTNSYLNHYNEIQNLKNRVLGLMPMADRILDLEFHESFGNGGFALGGQNDLNKATIIRLKRLFDCVKDNHDEATAVKVIYAFGAENSGRCIDGKRDRITELERQYVYIANGLNANADLDATVGLSLSKLFMDDRMNKLRTAINDLYPGEGEARTYGWSRSHKAILLGFGLSGKYEDMNLLYGGGHREGIDPIDFVNAYFEGGQVRGGDTNRVHNMVAFTVDTMADIVLQEIKKAMGGLFDDNTLDHMIKSNLSMRRASLEFQDNGENLNFENRYFKNGLQDNGEPVAMRQAIKAEAVVEILKNYNYVYTRNNDDDRWE